jgi:hypothetical protein
MIFNGLVAGSHEPLRLSSLDKSTEAPPATGLS